MLHHFVFINIHVLFLVKQKTQAGILGNQWLGDFKSPELPHLHHLT